MTEKDPLSIGAEIKIKKKLNMSASPGVQFEVRF